MMIAPEVLLRMYPLDALRAQIGEVLQSPLKASYLRIGEPESLGGVRTRVTCSVDKALAPVELWKLVGEFAFEYDRISLPAFTAGIPKSVNTALPAEGYRVLGTVLQPYRIPVVEQDIVAAAFTALGPVTLIANPTSYRWVGEVAASLAGILHDITTLLHIRSFTPSFTNEFKSVDFKRLLTGWLNMANAASLPEALTSGMYTYGTPVVNNLPDTGDNTKLTLTFQNNPYVGSVDVYYARRAFAKTSRFPVKLSGGQFTNVKRLNGPLSTRFGCTISEADIASKTVPMSAGETRLFTVDFAPTSPCYVGEVWVEYTRTI